MIENMDGWLTEGAPLAVHQAEQLRTPLSDGNSVTIACHAWYILFLNNNVSWLIQANTMTVAVQA